MAWWFCGDKPKGDTPRLVVVELFDESDEEEDWEPAGSGKAKSFRRFRPVGFQCYSYFSIVGITFRKDEAMSFANSPGHATVELEREPNNPRDPNAIKVMGVWDSKWSLIVYIPREIAFQICRSGPFQRLHPCLDRIYQGPPSDNSDFLGPYLDIWLEIIGPNEHKERFQASIEERVPSDAPRR